MGQTDGTVVVTNLLVEGNRTKKMKQDKKGKLATLVHARTATRYIYMSKVWMNSVIGEFEYVMMIEAAGNVAEKRYRHLGLNGMNVRN